MPGDGAGVVLYDETGSTAATVNASGQLVVSVPPPDPPPGTTAVNVSELGDVGGSSSVDTVTVITNGKTLTLTTFGGTGEAGNGDRSKVALYIDEDGTGSTLTLVRVAFTANNAFNFTLNQEVIGDGSRAIRMRRTRMDGGAREIGGFWDGYET